MKKYVRNLAVISAGIVFACSLSLTGCKAEEQKTEEKKTNRIYKGIVKNNDKLGLSHYFQ